MQIQLNNIGKRYNREWIFRHFNYQFNSENSYAITGANGSGKSTLLQVIAGAILHTEGSVEMKNEELKMKNDELYKCVSIAAPYLELVEEMTAKEMLEFHSNFKLLKHSVTEILQIAGLLKAADKQIRYFSSGMKQRLKLAQAFLSDTPVLLLDEPTTNLDADGITLYHNLINNYTKNKLVIISSNDQQEYNFCNEIIEIGHYK
ncbi:MAG: ABC transporter ATP-binding protein [Chitinophagaceae bacterium]|nr:ABC transporter ATP-binding protein [Chitinophagaceae bacterium]